MWSKVTVLVDSDDSDDPSLDQSGCFFVHRETSFRVKYQRMNDYEKDKNSSSIPRSCSRFLALDGCREKKERKCRKITEKLTEFFSDVRF